MDACIQGYPCIQACPYIGVPPIYTGTPIYRSTRIYHRDHSDYLIDSVKIICNNVINYTIVK